VIIQGCIEGYKLTKRYYTLDEAQNYLTQQTNKKFNDSDFVDLAKRGEIELCFFADLHFAVFNTSEANFEHLDEYPRWHCEGYYALDKGYLNNGKELPSYTNDARLIDSPSKDIHGVLQGRNEAELRLQQVPDNLWQDISISGYSYMSGDLEIFSRSHKLERDDYLIQATQLDALAEKMNQPPEVEDAGKLVSQQEKPMQAKERSGLLNIIAVMLELLQTPKSGRNTAAAVIDEMVENYPDKHGISVRNLQAKFADAKVNLQN
jgi:hypothetical protein